MFIIGPFTQNTTSRIEVPKHSYINIQEIWIYIWTFIVSLNEISQDHFEQAISMDIFKNTSAGVSLEEEK
jgi:hypothetical protein